MRWAFSGAPSGVAARADGLAGQRSRSASIAVRQRDDEQRRPEHVAEHDRLGQPGEVLHVPGEALGEGHPEDDEPRPGAAAALGGQPGGEPGGDHEPEEEHHHVGVQPRDRARVEAVARRLVGVAGVGAGAGDHGPEREDHAAHRDGDPREPGDERGDERPGGAAALVPGEPEVRGRGDERHRHEEVRGDSEGVQAAQHGDATEDRLEEDADEHGDGGGLHRPAGSGPPDEDDAREGDDEQHPRERPVAELDVLVERPPPARTWGRSTRRRTRATWGTPGRCR